MSFESGLERKSAVVTEFDYPTRAYFYKFMKVFCKLSIRRIFKISTSTTNNYRKTAHFLTIN